MSAFNKNANQKEIIFKQKQSTCICLTGDGHGEVLADDKLFSMSSGKSTEPVRKFLFADKSFRCADGLDGAKIKN